VTVRRLDETPAPVLSLHDARLRQRLVDTRGRLERALESNRRAIGTLYTSGTLFTKEGTRAGRELLSAHEHLLRASSLLLRLSHEGDVPAPRRPEQVEALFQELETLMERTSALTDETSQLLTELRD
jgi:hypothetical protein